MKRSYAMEIVEDYKKANKRMFILLLIFMFLSIGLVVYIIYLMNDINTITTTQEVSDIDTINGNVVNSGDNYGEDKANKNN